MNGDKKTEVLEQLKHIIDPDLGKDIVRLGFVKALYIEGSTVSFTIELTTPACPVKEEFRRLAEEKVLQLAWVEKVDVKLSARTKIAGMAKREKGLAGVNCIVAVASCKGGVGKSTVAVNLAFSLAKQGAKVGIFDADVYGPSLATLVASDDFDGLYQQHNLVLPVVYKGVKLMSFAYASAHSGGGPAIMRGPMVTQVIKQLLTGTNWGELDYLILDMPPGTGDVQLTLCQLVAITAAIIVTTPQKISLIDVEKGIHMFDKLKLPTIAVVENMSYFDCPGCETRHDIFAGGALQQLLKQFGIPFAIELPLDRDIAFYSDNGNPIVLAKPDGRIAQYYTELSTQVVRELSKILHSGDRLPEISHDSKQGISLQFPGQENTVISSVMLRRQCRCAHCIDELNGQLLLDPNSIDENIHVTAMSRVGRYAVMIDWTDGHRSIFPYEMLERL